MTKKALKATVISLCIKMVLGAASVAAQSSVEEVFPNPNSVTAEPDDSIAVMFDSDIGSNPQFNVFGTKNCRYEGSESSPSYDSATQTATFDTSCPFLAGETVTVQVSHPRLEDTYSWQFIVHPEFGRGEFAPVDPIPLGGSRNSRAEKSGSVSIASTPYTGDFDKDGFDDLAVVNQEQGQVVVISEIFTGSPVQSTIAAGDATTLVGGDVVGSNLPDVVTVNSFSNSLTVIENQNGILAELDRNTFDTGARPLDAVIVDVDGDGNQDVAVTLFGEDRVAVHMNNGSGKFGDAQFIDDIGAAPSSIVDRDVDRDGDLDLVVTSAGDERIEWLENNGSGDYSVGGTFDLDFAASILKAADIGGPDGEDGWVDFVVSSQNDGRVVALYNDANPNTFEFETDIIPLAQSSSPTSGVELVDIDSGLPTEEGVFDLDLVSTHPSLAKIQVSLNDAGSGYSVPTDKPTAYSAGLDPAGITALDFDGNGSQDLAVFDRRGTTLRLFQNLGGRESVVTVSPSPVNFSDVCLNSSDIIPVSVEVAPDISQDEVTIEAASPTSFYSTEPESAQVGRGDSESFDVEFVPGEIGRVEGELEFIITRGSQSGECNRSASQGERITVPLLGRGIATDLSTSREDIDFGEVLLDQEESIDFTVSNDGNIRTNVSVEGLDGSPFFISGPTAVGSERTATFTARFSPQTAGSFSREARITANAGPCNSQTVTVTLTGQTGPPTPDLVAERIDVVEGSPGEVNVTESLDVACVLSNRGNKNVTQSFSVELARDGANIGTFSIAERVVQGDSIRTPVQEISFPQEGTTSVSCNVDAAEQVDERSEENNTTSIDVSVQVADQLSVRPNPFTPNSDGFNDMVNFMVSEFGLNNPEVVIYSFEGSKIRTISNVTGGQISWRGENDSGEKQQPGVYPYVVREGSQQVASGYITLAR